MVKRLNIHLKLLFPFLLLTTIGVDTHAQKLPNVQDAGIWTPGGIKINGNTAELGNSFAAYNHAAELSYTLANNNENLYLTVQATQPRVIEQIIDAGITFMVNGEKRKVAVRYPMLSGLYTRDILRKAGDKATWSGIPSYVHGFPKVLYRTDSSVAAANSAIGMYAKVIKVKGVQEVPDTMMSVYNDQRVKVAAAFNSKGYYTYQLAIPLQYLGLSINDKAGFNYHILVDAYDTGSTFRMRDPTTNQLQDPALDADPDLDVKRDISGVYTLAKKP